MTQCGEGAVEREVQGPRAAQLSHIYPVQVHSRYSWANHPFEGLLKKRDKNI